MSPRLLRPRAAGGFDPRTISGLGFWYDFSDTSSVTLDGNSLIQQINDKSGNGRNLTQGTAANRPGIATVNGRQAGDWGTGTNVKHLANSTSGNWREVAVVLDYDGANPFGAIYGVVGGNAAQPGALTFNNTAWLTSAQGGGYSNYNTNGTETATALPAVLSPSVVQAWRTADTPTIDGIRVGTDRTLSGRGWVGKICEIMAWTRRLTTAERNAVASSLGRKWGISVAASTIPSVLNADAQDWIDRVYSNGGTVSTSTAAAVNTFCNDIDAAGIRDRFYRLNLFAGTGLNACLVPLYRGQSLGGTQFGGTTDTNNNFVSGDYVETGASGGLVGNGTTKYLNTGLATDVMPAISSFHLSQSVRDREAAGAGRSFIGMNDTLAGQIVALRQEGTTGNIGGLIARTTPTTMAYAAADSHAMVTRTSLSLLTMYRSGVSQATDVNTITVASSSRPLFVFCRNSTGVPTDYTGLRARMYSIGIGMDGTQAANFAAAVAAFNTALVRT